MKNPFSQPVLSMLFSVANKRLYTYVIKEILYIFFLSIGIITFLFVMSRLGKMADLIINRGVDLKDILLLILYSSPLNLIFSLPMAFLISTIVVLGRLSVDNEILSLKASGVDIRYLYVPIGFLAAAIAIFGLINTHVLLPKSAKGFRDTLINVIKKGITIEDKEGIFNDTIPGVVIYIDKVDVEKRELKGVLVSDDRDKNLKQLISAQSGFVNLDPVTLDLVFLMENGTLHRWEKDSDTYRNVTFKQYSYAMDLANVLPYHSELRKKYYEMDRADIQRLLSIPNKAITYSLLLELNKKVAIPLSSLAFLLIVVPLGIKRKVGGKFSGMIYSLFLFVLYYVLMAVTENIGRIFQVPTMIIAFLPNVIIAVIGIFLIRNINGEEPSKLVGQLQYLMGRYLEKT